MGLGLDVGVDAVQQVAEVGAGVFPVKRPGDGVVAGLERGEAAADLIQVGEVVGGEDFALDDGEVDFRLIQPGGVREQVDQLRGRLGRGHPLD